MEHFIAALPAIISGCAVVLLGAIARYVVKQLTSFREEHESLLLVNTEHGPLKADVEHIKENGATKEDITALREAIEAITHMVELMKGSDLDMIRNSIIRICNEAISQGWIDNHQLRSLCDLYDRYKKLGGNGYVDEMVAHAKALPVRNIKKGFIARLVARLAA